MADNFTDIIVNNLDDGSELVDTTPQDFRPDTMNFTLGVKYGTAASGTQGQPDYQAGDTANIDKLISRIGMMRLSGRIGGNQRGTNLPVDGYKYAAEQIEKALELAEVIQWFSAISVQSVNASVATEFDFDIPAMSGLGIPSDYVFSFRVIGRDEDGDSLGQQRDIKVRVPCFVDRSPTPRHINEALAECGNKIATLVRLYNPNDSVRFLGASAAVGKQAN